MPKQAAVMHPLWAFRDRWDQRCCPHAALSLMPPALGRSTWDRPPRPSLSSLYRRLFVFLSILWVKQTTHLYINMNWLIPCPICHGPLVFLELNLMSPVFSARTWRSHHWNSSLKDLKIVSVFMSICLLVCMYKKCMQCPQRPGRASDLLEVGLHMAVNARNWTQVLCEQQA